MVLTFYCCDLTRRQWQDLPPVAVYSEGELVWMLLPRQHIIHDIKNTLYTFLAFLPFGFAHLTAGNSSVSVYGMAVHLSSQHFGTEKEILTTTSQIATKMMMYMNAPQEMISNDSGEVKFDSIIIHSIFISRMSHVFRNSLTFPVALLLCQSFLLNEGPIYCRTVWLH